MKIKAGDKVIRILPPGTMYPATVFRADVIKVEGDEVHIVFQADVTRYGKYSKRSGMALDGAEDFIVPMWSEVVRYGQRSD